MKNQNKAFFKIIIETVSEERNISENLILKNTKERRTVLPRQICHVLANIFTDETLKTIGKEIGNKVHGTVLNSIKAINNLHDTDKDFQEEYDEIYRKVLNRVPKRVPASQKYKIFIPGNVSLWRWTRRYYTAI